MKDFIPYTESLALKELGFEEDCFARYEGKIKDIKKPIVYEFTFADLPQAENKVGYPNYPYKDVEAPLYSQAFRFFREKYNLHITIDLHISRGYTYNESYYFAIKQIKGSTIIKLFDNSFDNKKYTFEEWNKKSKGSFEEAELECLKKLIAVVSVSI